MGFAVLNPPCELYGGPAAVEDGGLVAVADVLLGQIEAIAVQQQASRRDQWGSPARLVGAHSCYQRLPIGKKVRCRACI